MLLYDIVESEFALQLHYYAHFQIDTLGQVINPLMSLVMDLI